jgi:hypothetical protein
MYLVAVESFVVIQKKTAKIQKNLPKDKKMCDN